MCHIFNKLILMIFLSTASFKVRHLLGIIVSCEHSIELLSEETEDSCSIQVLVARQIVTCISHKVILPNFYLLVLFVGRLLVKLQIVIYITFFKLKLESLIYD